MFHLKMVYLIIKMIIKLAVLAHFKLSKILTRFILIKKIFDSHTPLQ